MDTHRTNTTLPNTTQIKHSVNYYQKRAVLFKGLSCLDVNPDQYKNVNFDDITETINFIIKPPLEIAPLKLNAFLSTMIEDIGPHFFKFTVWRFFANKKGACEEYAEFSFFCLDKAKYKSFTVDINFASKNNSLVSIDHTICVYKNIRTERLDYLDNYGLKALGLEDLRGLLDTRFKGWTEAYVRRSNFNITSNQRCLSGTDQNNIFFTNIK